MLIYMLYNFAPDFSLGACDKIWLGGGGGGGDKARNRQAPKTANVWQGD